MQVSQKILPGRNLKTITTYKLTVNQKLIIEEYLDIWFEINNVDLSISKSKRFFDISTVINNGL